jgi:hypothetical protein
VEFHYVSAEGRKEVCRGVQIESQCQIGSSGFRSQAIQSSRTEAYDQSLLLLGASKQDDIQLTGKIIVGGRVDFEGAARAAYRDCKVNAGLDKGGVGMRGFEASGSPLCGGRSREVDYGWF